METLETLGYKITYSGPIAMAGCTYTIHANKTVDGVLQGIVAGYGNDEVTAISDAVATLVRFK